MVYLARGLHAAPVFPLPVLQQCTAFTFCRHKIGFTLPAKNELCQAKK